MQETAQEKGKIIRVEQLTPDIFRITAVAPRIAGLSRPGQFVMVRVSGGYDPLLRRPFSIHQVTANGHVQILFKVVGKGTAVLAGACVGKMLDLVGPLGRGFSLKPRRPVFLVGGGMGIAPLLFLGKWLLQDADPVETVALLGARTREELLPLVTDMEALGIEVRTATDDGSLGHHGLVGDLIRDQDPGLGRQVYACGPYPMMRAVSGQAKALGWPCEVSLETMMACGLSACLGCAFPRGDGAGHVHVCKDGPVFPAEEVAWL